jgi:hypothetical protein
VNYVIPENLGIIESNVIDARTGAVLKLRKQRGKLFDGKKEIIRTKQFLYTVKDSTNDGFFLFDDESNAYVFLDKNTPGAGLTSDQVIQIKRFDGVYAENILQFKFLQSPTYVRGYFDPFIINESISSAINAVSTRANSGRISSRSAIQNTKRPTLTTSEENILGYTYNSFSGRDVVIWQRLVLRDQDYVLNPADTTFGTDAITGSRLRTSVDKFVLGPLVTWTSTTSGVVTITLNNHSVQTGDTVQVSEVVATSGVIFAEGQYTATRINSNSFSITTSSTTQSGGTLSVTINDQNFQIRVPGLFIKVGDQYRRAFSTTDKPFLQKITDSNNLDTVANPTISGSGASFTGQLTGALSAESALDDTNPDTASWYSYNTTISELAQRIHPNGKDGAIYYHRSTPPAITTINVTRNGVSTPIYSVPLFTLA